ncbi:hypothetical protein Tco_0386958 [Tanacetum coccineum]
MKVLRTKTNEARGSVQEQPEEKETKLPQEDLQQMMMVVPVEEVYVEALQVKYPIIDWEVYSEDTRNSTDPTDDKERTLWVELKRLFEPDVDDILRDMIYFMLVEKDYPLSKGVLMLMLVNKLLVEEYSEMANELLKKIFILANRPRQGGLLGIKGFYKFLLLVQLSTTKRRLSTAKLNANLKLLRSLPSAWNNIALKMRNKSDLDTLSMDDLYNNIKVYESEIKVQSSSSSNSQNVVFVASENTSSTNEAVNIAHEVSTASSHGQASSSTYVDHVMFSFFANQSNSPQLDNEDLK